MLAEIRAAAGHIMGRAAGGALIGAGVNGYEYSQTGTGFGGSFSMGESLVSGAAAGAVIGGVVGALGAKRVAQAAGAKASKAAGKKGVVKSNIDWKERVPNTSSRINNRRRLTPSQSRAMSNTEKARIARQQSGYKNSVMTNAENPIHTPAAKYHFYERFNPKVPRTSYSSNANANIANAGSQVRKIGIGMGEFKSSPRPGEYSNAAPLATSSQPAVNISPKNTPKKKGKRKI